MDSQNNIFLPRPSTEVMRLKQLGSTFQTRLSFMRRLVRQMHIENWKIVCSNFSLDDKGYGTAVYSVRTLNNIYSLICFSHYLDPQSRTDRVIAENWDSTFTLFDGVPTEKDIKRLYHQTTKQESGRFNATDLVLSRANKSLRLFDHVVKSLASSQQPDPHYLNSVGYLMRTTAVYANGKFGLADRSLYASRPELTPPYQVEMLTVYLIREFSLDLVNHLANCATPNKAAKLDRKLKRYLGMGNATGLGMAPFLVHHPLLIHKWFESKEIAFSRVRSIPKASSTKIDYFIKILSRSYQHLCEWNIEDKQQKNKILVMQKELALLIRSFSDNNLLLNGSFPWNSLYEKVKSSWSVEGTELLVALILEPYPEIVDELGDSLHYQQNAIFNPAQTTSDLLIIVEQQYNWALEINFDDSTESQYFWYYSEEKNEPRRGNRYTEDGVDNEMKITVARDIYRLRKALKSFNNNIILSEFLMHYPDLRHICRRVQLLMTYPYAEIQDNIISVHCEPIDILRGKLAFFGASKFDPKSDLWTRITLCQGAPLRDELSDQHADDWCFPITPVIA
jgi:hypothetical protein